MSAAFRLRYISATLVAIVILSFSPSLALASPSPAGIRHELKGKTVEVELTLQPGPFQTTPTDLTLKITDLATKTPVSGAIVTVMAHPPAMVAPPASGEGHGDKAHDSHVDLVVMLAEVSEKPGGEHGDSGGHGTSEGHGKPDAHATPGAASTTAPAVAPGATTGVYRGKIHPKNPGQWTLEIVVKHHGQSEVVEVSLPVKDSGPNQVFLGITGGLMLAAMAASVVLKLTGKGGQRHDSE